MAKPIKEIEMLTSLAGHGFAIQAGDRCKVGRNRLISTNAARRLIADDQAIAVDPQKKTDDGATKEQTTLTLGETR